MLFILQGAGGGLSSLLLMAVMFVIFYFFFIRPQMKKQKDQNNFQSELKKGDEVDVYTFFEERYLQRDDRRTSEK
jgi:preprotein translocase subunit YajC